MYSIICKIIKKVFIYDLFFILFPTANNAYDKIYHTINWHTNISLQLHEYNVFIVIFAGSLETQLSHLLAGATVFEKFGGTEP